jgi:membrane fusion protein, multidrug efflux system
VLAYDQDDKRLLSKGSLLLVDNIIDQATATIRLKAIFANEDEALWSGEFVNIRVLLDTQKGVLAIPAVAVQRGPDGLYAWVVTQDNTAEIRPLKVGPTSNQLTIVESGLEAGERVITDGHYKLRQKIPVTVTEPRVAGHGGLS